MSDKMTVGVVIKTEPQDSCSAGYFFGESCKREADEIDPFPRKKSFRTSSMTTAENATEFMESRVPPLLLPACPSVSDAWRALETPPSSTVSADDVISDDVMSDDVIDHENCQTYSPLAQTTPTEAWRSLETPSPCLEEKENSSDTGKSRGSHKCDFCGKCFYTKWTLKRHVMSHTGEKPHSCDICNKSFASKWQLELHYRVHTGEKPYPCDICSKRFTTKSHLSRHRRTHSNKKSGTTTTPAAAAVEEPLNCVQEPLNCVQEPLNCVQAMSELTLQGPSESSDEPLDLSRRRCRSNNNFRHSPPKTITKRRLKETKSYQGAYSCGICKKQFSNLSKLKLHQRILHPRVLFVYGLTHVVFV